MHRQTFVQSNHLIYRTCVRERGARKERNKLLLLLLLAYAKVPETTLSNVDTHQTGSYLFPLEPPSISGLVGGDAGGGLCTVGSGVGGGVGLLEGGFA